MPIFLAVEDGLVGVLLASLPVEDGLVGVVLASLSFLGSNVN